MILQHHSVAAHGVAGYLSLHRRGSLSSTFMTMAGLPLQCAAAALLFCGIVFSEPSNVRRAVTPVVASTTSYGSLNSGGLNRDSCTSTLWSGSTVVNTPSHRRELGLGMIHHSSGCAAIPSKSPRVVRQCSRWSPTPHRTRACLMPPVTRNRSSYPLRKDSAPPFFPSRPTNVPRPECAATGLAGSAGLTPRRWSPSAALPVR